MGTVWNRAVVDKLIANDGWEGRRQVVKIVQYNNDFDGDLAYGLIYQGEDLLKYETAAACHTPVVLWQAQHEGDTRLNQH